MKEFLPISEEVVEMYADLILNIPEDDNSIVDSTSDSESTGSGSDNFIVNADDIYAVNEWYPCFKHLPQPQTILVTIPAEVKNLFIANTNFDEVTENSSLDSFKQQLEKAIEKVGGTAFIKNNWHAPKDAEMFSLNRLLKVQSAADVFTYMQLSNIIMHDFDIELKYMDFVVNVRPWIDIHPASEFRCIVVNKQLVGITPREWPKYYAHYKDIANELIDTLMHFFHGHIKLIYPIPNYTFDILYTAPDDYMLWDFGSLKESTKLYAFEWTEIKNIMDTSNLHRPPIFRYLETDCGVLPQNISYQQHTE